MHKSKTLPFGHQIGCTFDNLLQENQVLVAAFFFYFLLVMVLENEVSKLSKQIQVSSFVS